MTTLATPPRVFPTNNTPEPRPMGFHTWSHLLFAHWRVPPESLQPLIPPGLEVETFDGDAWLGLVAFHMSNVRPAWFPAVPYFSTFPETNIRTYVRAPNGETAVWFLSLDAASWPVVKVARWRWNLPYFHSAMSLDRAPDSVEYSSRRRSPMPADVNLSVKLGDVLRPRTDDEEAARPFDDDVGDLGRFLVDRYTLFADNGRGGLLRGVVRHPPYPLREATITRLDETLTDALGIPVGDRAPDHAVFSDGVDVDILPLEAAAECRNTLPVSA